MMLACSHARCAAACECFLNGIFSGYDMVAFKKRNRQKRNLLDGFYRLFVDFQMLTKSAIHQVVFVLETKHFECDFLKLLVIGNRKYVGMGNQEFFW